MLSIKGRTCNPSPLVHQDMTKKTTFYEKNKGKITQVKCKIGLWLLSSALSMYVPSLISIPFALSKARTSNHYKK